LQISFYKEQFIQIIQTQSKIPNQELALLGTSTNESVQTNPPISNKEQEPTHDKPNPIKSESVQADSENRQPEGKILHLKMRAANIAHGKGIKFFENKEYEEALDMFEIASWFDDKDPIFQNDLGVVFIYLGKPNEAKMHFENAISIDPENKIAQDNLNGTNRKLVEQKILKILGLKILRMQRTSV
jgi:tetratricopeptide (TPR) repeat protein